MHIAIDLDQDRSIDPDGSKESKLLDRGVISDNPTAFSYIFTVASFFRMAFAQSGLCTAFASLVG